MSPPRYTALELLARLVSFNTESDRSNLALIAFVEDYLAAWQVPFVRLPNAAGDKAAIVATIGPADRPGIVLSGHTDVVPVAGQSWTSDPFTLRVADGRAYGRGAVDMKGFLALGLSLVPDFRAARLRTPIHLFLSYDEETTCRGVDDGIARFGSEMPMPLAVIVGEPSDLEIADAHKSVVTFNTTVTGFEAHSSKPFLGASAITMAALLIAELDRIDQDMVARGDRSGRFDPPCTTIHVGRLNGGTARNIMAKTCAFEWEFRGLPDLDPAEIPARLARFGNEVVLPRFEKGLPGVGIETVNNISVNGLAPAPGSIAETLAMRLSGKNRTITVPYGTEAGSFQRAGAPTVVCGPGSINQAHQPDEYITLQALTDGEAFMRRLGDWCVAN
ncbi:MAG: acetylornithine deacetylase [Hyphomicrobiales bacterium]|nr:acetylornithine deacetylase [Hyphomicrobiales bacterium]